MAITVSVVISTVIGGVTAPSIVPVPVDIVIGADKIDLTLSPQTSNLTAEYQQYWIITVVGGNVWAHFFPEGDTDDNDAAPGKDWLILDTTTREFSTTTRSQVSFVAA